MTQLAHFSLGDWLLIVSSIIFAVAVGVWSGRGRR